MLILLDFLINYDIVNIVKKLPYWRKIMEKATKKRTAILCIIFAIFLACGVVLPLFLFRESCMDNEYFDEAVPVWVEGREDELNITCCFTETIGQGNYTLNISANNFYRVFLNGELIGYGPARATHGYFRVDEIALDCTQSENVIFIEVAGYNCNSFYALNTAPFFVAEVKSGEEVLLYSGRDFKCRVYNERVQKVLRFSYQRAFTESYVFNTNPQDLYGTESFTSCDVDKVKDIEFLPRRISYLTFQPLEFTPCEYGNFTVNENKNVYRDRYMTNERLKIFNIDELSTNPSDYACKLEYSLKTEEFNGSLNEGEYCVFEYDRSITGFIQTALTAKSDCHLLVLFDEIDYRNNPQADQPREIVFNRSTTVNIIEYKLKAGEFKHLSFEPYTARFIKIVLVSGQLDNLSTEIIPYENQDTDGFRFDCENDDINLIIQAAQNTFKQNAVDILTDCPNRERAGWLCDSFFIAQAEKLFTGQNKVEYNFLENYALYDGVANLPEDMLPMCYPADFEDGLYIPNWTMWYMVELYDYYDRTGDRSLVDKSKDNVYELISYFKKFTNSDGLLENLNGWKYVDGSISNEAEYVTGVSYPTNMMYSYALKLAGKLYNDSSLISKSEKMKATIRSQSFNGTFFEDNKIRENGRLVSTGNTSEACQYYAFFTEVANVNDDSALFNILKNSFGPNRDVNTVYPEVGKSNVFIGDYLRLEIFRRLGMYDQIASECIDYFSQMAERTGTLWEYYSLSGSLNHGFSSYVANLLVEYLTGFVRANDVNKVVYFNETNCTLDCDITIPLKEGEVHIVRADGQLTITVPDGYEIA